MDPATGKPLYRPETGRGPKGGHAAARRGGQGVGDYLYAAARDQQARKEARVEAERRAAAEEAARSRTTGGCRRAVARCVVQAGGAHGEAEREQQPVPPPYLADPDPCSRAEP